MLLKISLLPELTRVKFQSFNNKKVNQNKVLIWARLTEDISEYFLAAKFTSLLQILLFLLTTHHIGRVSGDIDDRIIVETMAQGTIFWNCLRDLGQLR